MARYQATYVLHYIFHIENSIRAYKIIKLLLKAQLPVCMKYTARGESRVANIARAEAKCYICHETLT